MIYPVILSGGSGTRLWPMSRSLYPKQLLALFGDTSLLQQTVERVAGHPGFAPPLIVANEEHRFIIAEQLREIRVEAAALLLEPIGRNTAPAAAVAALRIAERDPEGFVLVMPSDHAIADPQAFHQAVGRAAAAAKAGLLVTFGITPDRAETGYGYIAAGKPIAACGGTFAVARFVEKPQQPDAERYVAAGDYFWNSGIFLFRPSAFLAELKRYAPDVGEQVEQTMHAATSDAVFVRPGNAFASVRDVSIDYAVMEHSEKMLVVPVTFAWSDVGSWDAVRELMPADESGNVLQGDVLALGVTNSLIRSDSDVTVAVIGLDRVVCVVTEDAVFIAPLDRAQDVKKVVEELRARGSART
jgi:mannose-1-phosphate guanylyltransferase / mannose-6-phosphate isomerase